MGFKLNYVLESPGNPNSGNGIQTMALPFNQQTTLTNANDLLLDINATAGSPVVVAISRYLRVSDSLDDYTGAAGNNFSLTPGDGYYVKVSGDVNYIIVGSHAPTLPFVFEGPGSPNSGNGIQIYALPYHTTANLAGDLINEIDLAAGSNVVVTVSRYLRLTDSLDDYTGAAGFNFPLAPGEAYYVKVTQDISMIPSHY
jgi:hypothetical protein